jgi:AcrR family transcriptional regulator
LLTTKQTDLSVVPARPATVGYLDRVLSTLTENLPEPEINEPEPQSERGRRTHASRREEAETRILSAGLRIVAERGLQDLTLAECGQAAGYSRGLAAHYFGSREELIGSIARHIVETYSANRRASAPTTTNEHRGFEGLLDRVRVYIQCCRDSPDDTRAFHSVLGAAFKQNPLSDAIAELNQNSIAIYAAMIRQGIDAGEIRADADPRLQASILLATLRGVVRQWLADPMVDLEMISKELVANLRRSLTR